MFDSNSYLFILAFSVLMAFLVAEFARNKKIGYMNALLIGIFFSPVISLFVVLLSSSANEDTQPTATVSGADEIVKYKELLDQGIITSEEFETKKKQIIGS